MGATHREMHPTVGQVQILGDLAAGLTGTDHQHFTRRQLVGAAVLRRVDLRQLAGQPVGQPGDQRHLVRTRGQYDLIGYQLAATGTDQSPAFSIAAQAGSRDPFNDRWIEGPRICFDISNNVVAYHRTSACFNKHPNVTELWRDHAQVMLSQLPWDARFPRG